MTAETRHQAFLTLDGRKVLTWMGPSATRAEATARAMRALEVCHLAATRANPGGVRPLATAYRTSTKLLTDGAEAKVHAGTQWNLHDDFATLMPFDPGDAEGNARRAEAACVHDPRGGRAWPWWDQPRQADSEDEAKARAKAALDPVGEAGWPWDAQPLAHASWRAYVDYNGRGMISLKAHGSSVTGRLGQANAVQRLDLAAPCADAMLAIAARSAFERGCFGLSKPLCETLVRRPESATMRAAQTAERHRGLPEGISRACMMLREIGAEPEARALEAHVAAAFGEERNRGATDQGPDDPR